MKNLMVYNSPVKEFDKENEMMVRLQIDNSLELGWNPQDIILVTNFNYRYSGVRSLIVPDIYYPMNYASNKALVISWLLDNDKLGDDLYWYHDFDAYENYKIDQNELGMDGFDLGMITYCYKDDWQCGSYFFRKGARDIFTIWKDKILHRVNHGRADEQEMKKLTAKGMFTGRYNVLNNTYNLQPIDIPYNYFKAKKPIKVLHFHPWSKELRGPDTYLNQMMYGKSRVGKPIMSERLISLFNRYGIK